jgi:HlyD family secretion protein
MRQNKTGLFAGITLLLITIAFSSLPGANHVSAFRRSAEPPKCWTVRRADFDVPVLAPGLVQCSEAVVIRCELERMNFGTGASAQGNASTIMSLIPEGTFVKKGDLLCELDSSDFRALAEQQQIKVAQAKAEERQAALDLEIAEISEHEYKEGLSRQTVQQYLGQLALARSDLQRGSDRLHWSARMLEKGYLSAAQLTTEQLAFQRSKATVDSLEQTYRNYQKFAVPRESITYQSLIEGAKAQHQFQMIRLQHEEERLAYYERQVEHCTIRAPQDGVVIYANEKRRAATILLDAPVRQRQQLFFLPDITHLEVAVYLHETVVERINVGMPVRIRAASRPDEHLEGHVVFVSPLPLLNRDQDSSNELKYYVGRVQIDSAHEDLMPGVTAEVEIITARRHDEMVIPCEAVKVEDGQKVCYVVKEDHFERREVEVAPATHDLVQVLNGLKEGEKVAVYPTQLQLTDLSPPPSTK